MSKARKKLLGTELQEPVDTCRAHRLLVEVLLEVDRRLSRLEILVTVTLIASLGAGGKTAWEILRGLLA